MNMNMASKVGKTFPSSSSNHYHVFFSVRIEDTCRSFVRNLYKHLEHKGLLCFKHDGKPESGKPIPLDLLKAIEGSKIAVVVISQNYASSSWCLDELVKIIECKEIKGQSVFPIFHDVDPLQVKDQTGSFAQVLAEYEKDDSMVEKAQRWRVALTKVALIDGWNSRDWPDDHKLTEEVSGAILKAWSQMSFSDINGLVGIDSRVEQIQTLLDMEFTTNVLFVGIWGMGGIGKTTTAKALFTQISNEFEAAYFVANVREESEKRTVVRLRDEILSNILEEENLHLGMRSILPRFILNRLRRKRILIVLDDVSNVEQLTTLAGDHSWFGSGSRVIITSRDKQVLVNAADRIYEVKGLNYCEALQLLSFKVFKQNHPVEGYIELSKRVVNYTKGVPLALNVLASFLYSKQREEWTSTLEKLEESSNLEIQKVLKISYDELEWVDKDIFLDIACFFKGADVDYVTTILDGCDFFPSIGISRLVDKSLIAIIDNKLDMHDLLQEMGQHIVQKESSENPGKNSRLWTPESIHHVLTGNRGTFATEGIFLDISKIEKVDLSSVAFSKMWNLRLLKFYHNSFLSWKNPTGFVSESTLDSRDGLQSLPNKLCFLHWHGYPWESLPSNFSMENLVELNMPFSQVKELWTGVKHLQKLKLLDLHDSELLVTLPDLSSASNLEKIILNNCTSLLEIPSSIQCLRKLVCLSLSNCKELQSLPSLIPLKYLKTLNLSSCSNLKKFPEISGEIEELHLDGTGLEEWPSSVQYLDKLRLLSLDHCEDLKSLPGSIHLNSLDNLDLSWCSSLKNFPDVVGNIKYLNVGHTAIEELPSSIGSLVSLTKLNLKDTEIKELPSSIGNLSSLVELNLKESSIKELPSSIGCLSSLVKLNIAVVDIEELPSSLGQLSSLVEFNLEKSTLTALPSSIGCLTSLVKLNLAVTEIKELPPSIGCLSSLVELNLSQCPMLGSLPFSIGELKCLEKLYLCGLRRLRSIPSSIRELKRLQDVYLNHCTKLSKLPSLSGCSSLRDLVLSYSGIVKVPGSLGYLSSLQVLLLKGNNFMRIPATIRQLSWLEVLDISYCKRLKALPELPQRIRVLVAHNCTSLKTVSSPLIQFQESQEQSPDDKYGFTFANCVSLEKNARSNIVESALLKTQHLATAVLELLTSYEEILVSPVVCFPGSEIPECFRYQNTGASVTTLLPSKWHNNKLVGFTFCAVIELENRHYQDGFTFQCDCRIENEYGDSLEFTSKEIGEWGNQFEFETDHVFLWNTSCIYILTEERYEQLRKNSCTAIFEFACYTEDEYKVMLPGANSFKVKNSGFNPVYAKDEKEWDLSIDQTSSSYDPMQIFLKDGASNLDYGIHSNKKMRSEDYGFNY
ncbi:disease resistance protein RPV1 isoform X1 [Ricinus communis]|uniref:disease resistance protein RPV1 isoform X1 n=1 Tax=Ricinus communis TaxID=3988 RepID=UPI00201A4307|nr:disease resistance protein RPV1 isoform X1 [Ricinus communis]XP_048228737.1 disease resistance protein RPV1 isoform X1 [Ricinus communis]XP_048228738.1 disease resistance protein RPV1 isoform X1 [Ricinus communis]XP_048228739.1 disease resistance protein RPV1 isoform X1 [Ricinus communis]XP_048228740.1 disease resistance protein RPV1 isoform X1 [Ricinus communis]XP_048228741.1 disease resistance protein RPV1 isoform X1 [Ricinus communis]XP_048228742.1 disease resistance protein RPV1 isofor